MKTISKLTLKSGRDRSLLNRHPWVFSGAVKSLPKAENGEIVGVYTNHHELLGYGFYSPESQIICRMFDFTAIEKDDFGAAYWLMKFEKAWQLRNKIIDKKQTDCFRLIHAEGDFFPGIIVDIYGSVAVLQILIKGTELVLEHIIAALKNLGFQYIYLKNKENTKFLEAVTLSKTWLTEPLAMPVIVKENGLKFEVNVETGQKTGFFLDQRDNRELLKSHCHGKKVLNAFSYSGGFSIYALEAGASEVHSVDISKDAIAHCDANVKINFGDKAKHKSFVLDCFDYLKQTEEQYDVIVLDPPAFAKSKKAVDNAARGYKELNLTAFRKIKPGGLLFTYSCSQNITPDLFRKIIFGAAADSGRNVRIIRQLSQAEDHPINIYHPEGEYLKGLMLYVE